MTAPLLTPELESAVDWMVLLSSGSVAAADRVGFERWRQSDPRHAEAWETVNAAVKNSFDALGQGGQRRAAGAVLQAPPARRRALRKMLALALAAGGLAALADRQTPLRTLTADLRTGTAERRVYTLPDGSELTLNARSAVDLDFSLGARRVLLRSGAVYVRVASDASRPFVVASADGEVQALGTVFGVAREGGASVASVIEHSVEVRADGQRRILHAGEGVRFGAGGLGQPDALLGDAAAWQSGMLVVHDEPLGAVVDALRPYRRGVIRITPAAARLRVLGAFPLDDTDKTLESLRQTLPIDVSSLGGWLVGIDLRADGAKKR
ncbi:FecR family protein [Achromobacter arsenitoxydans]|uniref:Fe2+-dicitrate sensor, membrane component n=1 Tax=Achromobacter arsenitoxydans SY8 TaxID=477184 RepID=H0F585_9BURK|nr:FecR family protein [Achromobacter arsenitoxydans]EHK66399.1 Fe2+-dicitrate sensor, membrane component [Achromobacter arsenitoxydans SY8]